MNLNEVWHYEDEADTWAAEREFELRKERYQFWLDGGVTGVVKRLTKSMETFSSRLSGDPERGSDGQAHETGR